MLKKEDWLEIKAPLERGMHQKGMAKEPGVHPRTIRRATARRGAPPGVRPGVHKSRLDGFKPFVTSSCGRACGTPRWS